MKVMDGNRLRLAALALGIVGSTPAWSAVVEFQQALNPGAFVALGEGAMTDITGNLRTGSVISVNWDARTNQPLDEDTYSNSHFDPGFQSDNHTICGGLTPCTLLNGQAVAVASASVDAAGIHAAAYTQTDVATDRVGSASSKASGVAGFGTRVTLDKAAVVTVHTTLDGVVGAFGSNASAEVDLLAEFIGDSLVVNRAGLLSGLRYGGMLVTRAEDTTADGGSVVAGFPTATYPLSFDVSLPAGTSYFFVTLSTSAFALSGTADADFSHTLHVSLTAPADVQLSAEGNFLPAPVPLPAPALLLGSGLLAVAARARQRRGATRA